MSKSRLSWVAVALVLGGVAVLTGHPAWGMVTGGILILLAGAAAAAAARIRSERHGEGSRGQRVPNNLVTLSAAAIIAVYAAGFSRTRAAADAFAAQAARRRAPAPIAASLAPPKATQPAAQAPPVVATVAAPSPAPVPLTTSKKDRAPDAPLRVHSKASSTTAAKAAQPELTASLSAPPAITPAATSAGPNAAAAAPPTAAAPSGPAESLAGQTAAVPAPPNAAQAAPVPAAPKVHYRDGTYYGWGRSAHGDIRASVVIQGGKIASTGIDKCQTAYSCSWIAALPGQVVTRQAPSIDCVSGASDSSYAFQDAITAALFRAQGG